jgi:hypothetical protein
MPLALFCRHLALLAPFHWFSRQATRKSDILYTWLGAGRLPRAEQQKRRGRSLRSVKRAESDETEAKQEPEREGKKKAISAAYPLTRHMTRTSNWVHKAFSLDISAPSLSHLLSLFRENLE